MSKRRWFGTDGIRGHVGDGPISADFVLKLGWALGRVLARGSARPSVVIGKDTRISGYMFESALQAGLVAAGADVHLSGPMPTPAIAFLTRELDADAGIVISASHNPHHDNGIKFFNARGEKLDDATELAIEAMLDQPFATQASDRLGRAVRIANPEARYAQFCESTVPADFDLAGLRIAVDCAHGATYQIAPTLFAELGAAIEPIGVAPNGLNINDGVGSTHMDTLAAHVRAMRCDLGIAFDGDGDRMLMVDADGRVVDGDALLYVLALDWHVNDRLRGPVVGTLMSNYGLEQALSERGIGFLRANVGDRHVHRALIENGGTLGGEASGHLLCLDRVSTGDGIISALQVLETLRRSKRTLAQALHGLHRVPQRTVNVRYGNGAKPAEDRAVQAELDLAQKQVAGRGRAFIRASGTEPVVRVTVEADDEALVRDLLDRLSNAVRAAAQ
ncbi:MAG: phosphoglucosamine mutase [Proteobacteria bacterium]|nr:phosphoglucosamine mutase [Pseudomonadota bacterium]MBS0462281.1 phosphoglucosamine mutase [Pseudomonadota bacterium]MBS0465499.1 phosphoglucosamine mutase [Pseudomonadota bacterium]